MNRRGTWSGHGASRETGNGRSASRTGSTPTRPRQVTSRVSVYRELPCVVCSSCERSFRVRYANDCRRSGIERPEHRSQPSADTVRVTRYAGGRSAMCAVAIRLAHLREFHHGSSIPPIPASHDYKRWTLPTLQERVTWNATRLRHEARARAGGRPFAPLAPLDTDPLEQVESRSRREIAQAG